DGRRDIRCALAPLSSCVQAVARAESQADHELGNMNLVISPPASTRHFLGVERSATGRAWRDRLDERASARALAIVQRHGLPELLARVLAGRGVEVDDAVAFLDPNVRTLMPDPDTLAGMAAAAARLADAVERSETVAI